MILRWCRWARTELLGGGAFPMIELRFFGVEPDIVEVQSLFSGVKTTSSAPAKMVPTYCV
jgi:hypothetical protein